jgi:hypothetical protein
MVVIPGDIHIKGEHHSNPVIMTVGDLSMQLIKQVNHMRYATSVAILKKYSLILPLDNTNWMVYNIFI